MDDMNQVPASQSSVLRNFVIAAIILALLVGVWMYLRGSEAIVFSLDVHDTIDSWETSKLQGIDETELQAKIVSLEEELRSAKGLEETYGLHLKLAQNYKYNGDGRQAFNNLSDAITLDPETALAYINMGSLLDELGATTSARVAFETGLSKQLQLAQNHLKLLDFLTHTEGVASEDIDSAFRTGLEHTGKSENILKEYATWLEREGRNKEAITVWEQVLAGFPDNVDAIRARIESLR